jgi:hypothetical protein
MKRVVFYLFMVLTAAMSTAVFIGRAQPLPNRLAMLNLSECAPPCWIGIQPGVTYLAQARLILEQVYAPNSGYSLTYLWDDKSQLEARIVNDKNPQDRLIVKLNTYDAGRIIPLRTITLDFTENELLPVPELITLLGEPLHVFIGRPQISDYPVLLKYGRESYQGLILTTASKDRLTLTGKIRLLRFFNSGVRTQTISIWHDPWRGFTSLANYRAQ